MVRVQIHSAIAVIVALISGVKPGVAVEVRLRDQVMLNSSVVRLADVAEIVATDGERAQLAGVPLMPTPAPGTQRFLRQREIADLLAAHGFDLHGVQFGGATQVEIICDRGGWTMSRPEIDVAPAKPLNRHAAVLAGQVGESKSPNLATGTAAQTREELNELIVSYLSSTVPQAASWSVNCDVPDRQLALVRAATSTPECKGGNPPWTGRQRFVVSFHTSEGMVHVPVYAEVSATSTPIVVALRPLSRGKTITAADVELRAVDHLPKTSSRGAAVESLDELIGMQARQPIRAGEVVFTDQVQAPRLVKRGELITVSSQAGGIRVRTTARAREDGVRGELVQVESLDTRERFDARVVGPRAAAVFALSRPAADESTQRIDTARR